MKRLLTYLLVAIFAVGRGHATDIIGSISGNLAVSESGAATYTIPLDILKSENDFMPSLSLVYNSQSGNGLAGYGWSLSGLSSITIGPRNVYFDGTAEGVYRGEDNAYYLDGMRLLLKSGTNGQVGAVYRTESEQYSIITITSTLGNTPASFTVKTKDGNTYKYGSQTGRMMYSATECYEWALDYAEDRLGNYISYTYGQDGLMLYPQSITYGGNIHNSSAQTCTIAFTCDYRRDKIPVHKFERTEMFHQLLIQISCSAGDTTYKRYNLTYDLNNDTNIFSHLVSVKEVGLNFDSYPATTFTWENLPNYSLLQDTESVANVSGVSFSDMCFLSADIDNNGQCELLGLYGQNNSGSPYKIVKAWKKNAQSGNFAVAHTYATQNGISIGDIFQSVQQGGVVAHSSTRQDNSIIFPCAERISDDRWMNFYFLKENVRLTYPIYSSANSDCHIITDVNNDGIDDVILVEKKKYGETYHASILHADAEAVSLLYNDFTMNLAGEPSRLAVADFNGDGMADLLVCTSTGFYIYWNNAGEFSDNERFFSTEFCDCDVLEICDVNGDGLPDMVVNKKNSSVWLSCLNQGTTSNIFLFHHITPLEARGATNAGNDYAYCFIQDLNSDGKTDVLAGVSSYSGNVFAQGEMVTLLSNGASYEGLESYYFYSQTTFPKRDKIVQGDFDGDGVAEIMYYGGTPNSTSSAVTWHTLKLGGFTPTTNRIKEITDGLGVVHSIDYGILTDDEVYGNTGTETFPLLRLRAPMSVAKRIETIADADSLWTAYTYDKAVFHWQGKRFLGFRNRTVTDHIGNRTEVNCNVNTDYFVLYKTSENTYANDNSLWKTDSLRTQFRSVGPKSYFAYTDYCRSYDVVNGWEDRTLYGYDTGGNLSGTKTFTDGMFIRDTDYTFWHSPSTDIYLTGLPSLVETTQSGGNLDTQETERIEYTRDNLTGLPLVCKRYQNDTLIETELFTYNSYGKVLTHTVIKGDSTDSLTTSYQYMGKGFLYKETDPLGLRTTYSYNIYGFPISSTDHLGVHTTYTYDSMLRRKSFNNILASSNKTIASASYGNAAYQITETRKGLPTIITYYDRLNRKVAEAEKRFDGQFLYTDYRYLKNGKVGFVSFPHTESSPSSAGTTNTYDQYNRLISQTDTEGKTSTWSYQPFTVTSTVDGVTRTTYYGSRDMVVEVVDEDGGGDICYDTDAYGRVVTALHYVPGTTNCETTVSYDDFGRITQTNDMLGTTRNYTYDANGYPQAVAQGNSTRQSQYDKYGRLLSQTFHDSNEDDTQTFYTYNSLNQLVCDSSSNHVYRYEYDSHGRVNKETRSVMADSTETVSYTYSYNLNNQLAQKKVELPSAGTMLTETHTYANGWRKEIKINGTSVWKLTAEDTRGYPSTTSNALDTIQWNHDVYGHLLSQNVHGQHSLSQSYTYDLTTGNLIQKGPHTYTYDNLNQLTGWNGMTYAYDSRSNITQMGALGIMQYSGFKLNSVDVAWPGAVAFQRGFSYLNSIERPLAIVQDDKSLTFAYDGDQQRVWMKSHTRQGYQPIVNTGIRYYLSDDCEIDQKFSSHKRYYYYVGGTPYDAPAVVLVENSVPTVYQIYRDNIGSINMYASSASVKSLYYSPWGQRLQNATGITPYTYPADELFIHSYTGHEELPIFHLLNANARIYDPTLGRFLSPDPLLALSGYPLDFNPYAYARNNPFSYVDQDGKFPWLFLAAAIIGGFSNVMYNKDNIHNFAQGLAFFGVGAAATAAGAAVSFIPMGIGGAIGGAILGTAGGGVSGFILGGGNALITGQDFWKSALTGAWQGAIIGGVGGAVYGGLKASYQGKNFWTGKPIDSSISSIKATNSSTNSQDSEPLYIKEGEQIQWPNPDYVEGTKHTVILDEGTIIDRYSPVGGGSLNNGTYFSEPGVPYPNRSLPYNPTNVEYGRWKLKIPLQAEKSIVAPIPQYRLPGGGIQYRFLSPQEGYMNANQMMKNGWIYKF